MLTVRSLNKLLRGAAALTAALALCGCSGASVENLLTAPKLTQEQSKIYQALINSTGSSVRLKYPRGGEFRSAFVLQDIDDEPGDEALVFYESQSVQSGESALRLKVLDQYDGEWQAVYDLACVGSEVDSISFAKLGEGKCTEVIVCYSMLNQTEKTLSVMNYDNGIISELYSGSYACMEVIDLNSDGMDELVTVVPDKTTQTAMATMFTRNDDGLVKLGETPLGDMGADFISVTKGQLFADTTGLFVDYSRGNGQYGTDVLYCRNGRLMTPVNFLAGEDGTRTSVISRFTNDYMTDIRSTDIDGDGCLEIPSMSPLPGYETLTRSEQLCAVVWYTVRNNSYEQEYYSYYSSKYNFALLFPSRWQGVVTAVVNSQDNEIIFISYNQENGLEVNDSTELMRIRTIDKDDTEALVNSKDYHMIGENDENIICCKETTGYLTGKLALTESELRDSFIVL